MKDVYSRSSDKNEKNISMKNLEKIIKLLIKFNELKKNRKRGKNRKKKYVHEKQRYEAPGIVTSQLINTALDNAKKDNEYLRNEMNNQNENKFDIELLKKALTGNVSSSMKLLKNVPEAKDLLEDYYKKNGSKILMDIDREETKKLEYYKNKKLNEMKTIESEYEDVIDKLRGEMDVLSKERIDKFNTISSLEYDLNILKDEHNKINESYKFISDELNKKTNELGLTRKENEKLKKEIDENIKNIELNGKKIHETNNLLHNMNEELENIKNELQEKKENLEKAKRDKKITKEKLKKFNDDYLHLENEYNKLNEDIKDSENVINKLRIDIEEKQKELKETNEELFKTVSNTEKQFFNGRENTRELMIKYLKDKHGITEINNKKISSYTSIFDKNYLKKYIEENYGITELYKFYSKHNEKNDDQKEEKEEEKKIEREEKKVEKHSVEIRLGELIDLGFTDEKKSIALNSGDEKQNDLLDKLVKTMSKGYTKTGFSYDVDRYNRYVERIKSKAENKELTKDQLKYLKLFNEYLYIYTNDELLPNNVLKF